MLKTVKFGGSSVAGAEQFRKVKAIVEKDPSRRVVVISAAGKRNSADHKLTDLLYLCHAHLTYGVSCDDIFETITERFVEIRDELGLTWKVEDELADLKKRLNKNFPVDELVSRGEYFTAKLMAEYLGYTFVDAASCIFFGYDGKFDIEKTYATIDSCLKTNGKIVIPGFYGSLPTGKIKVMTRGGGDVTGALAAAAVGAAVPPASAESGSSPGSPITHTFSRQGTSSPSSYSTFKRVPATSASHSNAALSVS